MRWDVYMLRIKLVWDDSEKGPGARIRKHKDRRSELIGHVEADTRSEAMRMAEETWPIPAEVDASKLDHAQIYVDKARQERW